MRLECDRGLEASTLICLRQDLGFSNGLERSPIEHLAAHWNLWLIANVLPVWAQDG